MTAVGGLQRGTYYGTGSYGAYVATQSSRSPSGSVHPSQPSQPSTRAQESVVRQIHELRDELLRRIAEHPQSAPMTDDPTITARFDSLEQSIMELRTLSQTTERTLTSFAAATERRQTELEGSHAAMGEQLARIGASQDMLSRSVAENTARVVSAMDSYNARLLALEQIRPPGSPASTPTPTPTPTPSMPLPPLSGSAIMLSPEQYGFLLSQMRSSGSPPSDQQQ